jgi:pimeloyl-ACP methyl ester carboxylesterase
MTDSIELHAIHPENHAAKRATSMDIVFIHGLDGDHDGTWRSASGFWPQWVADDHLHAQVWSLGYPAKIGHLLQLGNLNQLNAEELAHALADRMRNKSPAIGSRPCIFVCHSLGGLLAKRILINAISSTDIDRFRHENVAAVMFLGTPHRGSGVSNALQTAEKVKDVALKHLLPFFGIDLSSISDKILTTTKLIGDLEQNNVPLQHLNEEFQLYYARRNRQDVLRIRVFAEKQKMKVGPFRTAIVVDEESANPNLRPDAGQAAIDITLVPSADHSSLVKPTARDREVCEGLNKLIELVRDETGVFDLRDSLRNQVARMIFLAIRPRPLVLKLPQLMAFAGHGDSDVCARNFAEAFAQRTGAAVRDGVMQLKLALKDLVAQPAATKADIEAIERVSGALILLALNFAAPAGEAQSPLHFDLPFFNDLDAAEANEMLEVMIEVAHAKQRGWPSRWGISDDKTAVQSGAWLLKSPALSAPSSWHNEANIEQLIERINASAPEGDKPKTGVLGVAASSAGEGQPSAPPVRSPRSSQLAQTKAKELLNSRLTGQLGLVISATQGCDGGGATACDSPYRSAGMRTLLTKMFGNLVSLALPRPSQDQDDELFESAAQLKVTIQQFMIQAQEAHSRVKPHAQ